MKYKDGDKVRIRSWEDMEKQFGLDRDGDINTSACFVKPMRKYCGKMLTISNIRASGNFDMKESEYIFSEDEFEKNHIEKIVITADGAETLARLYEDGKVVKSATAKCSPEDEFDFNIGAKLAFDRLVERTDEKKEKYYNGKVVCVESDSKDYTVGKIYECINGIVKDNDGSLGYTTCPIKDPTEIVRFQKFIPLVEETKGE
jgi:TATA-box binding protein (TBP) (component of TFIID and TFIIIB)